MTSRALAALLACAICAACGGRKPEPVPPPTERLTGNERLAWDQEASDAVELASFRYAIYIDGVRSELADVTCAPLPPAFACSTRLPTLGAGAHTLEVATFITDVAVLESPKSDPLRVTSGAAAFVTTGPGAQEPGTGGGARAGATRVPIELIASELQSPNDLVFAPDGRIFVAERTGQLRIIRNGRLDPDAALVDDVDSRGGGGLLAEAIAPGFADTHYLYLLHTATGRFGDMVFRVVRYREVNGTLGDRVVLLDDIPAAPVQPRGALRFGSDGMLYVAFDDGGDERASHDRSSYSGKLLRINPDGSTPRDQASPIIGEGFRSPRGFDWSPINRRLWVADVGRDGIERLVAGSTSYALPSSTGASGVAFNRSGLMVGGTDAMMRLQVNARSEQVEALEQLLGEEGLTPIRAVVVSPAGDTYFCTETSVGRLLQ